MSRSVIIGHYVSICVKKWKIPFADLVSLHRELSEAPPFGSRSLLERSPFVLRYSFVPPSFLLRSILVREAKKHRRDNEQKRNQDLLNCHK